MANEFERCLTPRDTCGDVRGRSTHHSTSDKTGALRDCNQRDQFNRLPSWRTLHVIFLGSLAAGFTLKTVRCVYKGIVPKQRCQRQRQRCQKPNNKLVWYESVNNLSCTFWSIRHNSQILRADLVKRRFFFLLHWQFSSHFWKHFYVERVRWKRKRLLKSAFEKYKIAFEITSQIVNTHQQTTILFWRNQMSFFFSLLFLSSHLFPSIFNFIFTLNYG